MSRCRALLWAGAVPRVARHHSAGDPRTVQRAAAACRPGCSAQRALTSASSLLRAAGTTITTLAAAAATAGTSPGARSFSRDAVHEAGRLGLRGLLPRRAGARGREGDIAGRTWAAQRPHSERQHLALAGRRHLSQSSPHARAGGADGSLRCFPNPHPGRVRPQIRAVSAANAREDADGDDADGIADAAGAARTHGQFLGAPAAAAAAASPAAAAELEAEAERVEPDARDSSSGPDGPVVRGSDDDDKQETEAAPEAWRVPIIGNGDVMSFTDWNRHVADPRIETCMIGRGSLIKVRARWRGSTRRAVARVDATRESPPPRPHTHQ